MFRTATKGRVPQHPHSRFHSSESEPNWDYFKKFSNRLFPRKTRRILLVVFCEKVDSEIRIISARKAEPPEVKADPEAATTPISIRLDGSVLAVPSSSQIS